MRDFVEDFARVWEVTVCFCGLSNVVWEALEHGTILGFRVLFCANFEFWMYRDSAHCNFSPEGFCLAFSYVLNALCSYTLGRQVSNTIVALLVQLS